MKRSRALSIILVTATLSVTSSAWIARSYYESLGLRKTPFPKEPSYALEVTRINGVQWCALSLQGGLSDKDDFCSYAFSLNGSRAEIFIVSAIDVEGVAEYENIRNHGPVLISLDTMRTVKQIDLRMNGRSKKIFEVEWESDGQLKITPL